MWNGTGEIFKFFGRLSFMLSHGTSLTCPSLIFWKVSRRIHSAASVSFSTVFEFPFNIAASISSLVQSRPQSTGHPFVAYSKRSSAAG